MILYAICAFDKNTPSPSLYTLVPTIGAGLIIVFANNKNLVGKILGSKAFVGIGLISYSAYLWHQPLLAFARIRMVDNLSDTTIISLCLGSLVLGYLSWKFVENPFRSKVITDRKLLFLSALFFSFIFIGIGFVGYKNKGFEKRLTEQQRMIADWQNYDFTHTLNSHNCFMYPEDTYLRFKSECFGKRSSISYQKKISLNKNQYFEMQNYSKLSKIDARLISLSENKKIKFISLLDVFCINNRCLTVTEYEGKFWLTSWDSGHLTEAGSIYLYTNIKNIINE